MNHPPFPELGNISGALRQEDALTVYPHIDGGYRAVAVKDPEGKTCIEVSNGATFLEALNLCIEIRLTEETPRHDLPAIEADHPVFQRLANWIGPGRRFEATLEEGQIVVTLFDYVYEQGDRFVREGRMSGCMTEIVGVKVPDHYRHHTLRRGSGPTFPEAVDAAFRDTAIRID